MEGKEGWLPVSRGQPCSGLSASSEPHLPLPEAVPLCLMGAGTRACGVENARGLLPAAFVSHLPPMPLHLRREMTISNRVSVTDAVGILSLG